MRCQGLKSMGVHIFGACGTDLGNAKSRRCSAILAFQGEYYRRSRKEVSSYLIIFLIKKHTGSCILSYWICFVKEINKMADIGWVTHIWQACSPWVWGMTGPMGQRPMTGLLGRALGHNPSWGSPGPSCHIQSLSGSCQGHEDQIPSGEGKTSQLGSGALRPGVSSPCCSQQLTCYMHVVWQAAGKCVPHWKINLIGFPLLGWEIYPK